MATILLQAAGAALGAAFGPVGAAFGPVGVALGRAAGALAGSAIDHALFSSGGAPARLATARVPGPEDGTAIPRLYGTARIGGTLIWSTRFLETAVSERAGGKGMGRTESYAYSVSLALGLCEGPIAGIRRIWADGRELPLSGVEYRVHTGSRNQQPDPLIEAKQGAGRAPAYRGLAYVVFENLPLKDFGNRIPLLQFEVMRPIGTLESQIRAVTLIPGATEHGYDPREVTQKLGGGAARRLNRNTSSGKTDWETSLDELQALCPNLESVSLVVSWFGSDLRLDRCRIEPGVEVAARPRESVVWSVSGISRANAHLISQSGGGPAFGGTPSDGSVIRAIRDLKARGLKVFLYPFLQMDIPAGNTLPDPQGGAAQAPYPWRGRITSMPAPGRAGTPDGTSAMDGLVASFFGAARTSDFNVAGESVTYSGSDAGYARMILHQALLARAAGGVDGFIIGSELRGITTLRNGVRRFPAVQRLIGLAEQVRSLLGPSTFITYGADWSEYSGYQPPNGSGDFHFHLDELWASSAISAVGIDNYLPLADFRDSDFSTPQPDGFRHQEDPAGLQRQITSGERFNWYYASDADRWAGRRTPVTDGLAGKPWVYAPKDIASWWSNRHFDRVNGQETTTPTAWTGRMKPVCFIELGCPAIDRGGNQPNVFLDPKSSESFSPWFSRGYRSDSVQRRFLEAHFRHWSSVSAPAGMVSPGQIFIWCWDTRPFPAFPHDLSLWKDGANWQTGHWLNGRLGAGTLADVLAAIMRDHGFTDFDVSGVTGDLTGYVKGDLASARALIEPLLAAFQVDVIEDAERLRFVSRGEASLPARSLTVLAEADDEPVFRETRTAEAEMPSSVVIGFDDPAQDYELATARARRQAASNEPVYRLHLPAACNPRQMARLADGVLRDLSLERRAVRFRLSPNDLDLQPGDVVTLPEGPRGRFLVTHIEDGADRLVEAREFASASPSPSLAPADEAARPPRLPLSDAFAPEVILADLPRLGEGEAGRFAMIAALARPWRAMSLSVSPGSEGYAFRQFLNRPARIGTLAAPLAPGDCEGRFDGGRLLVVDLGFGALSSASRADVLQGANRIAVEAANGVFEVIGFASAREIAAGRFELSGLLNGLHGTGDATRAGAEAGARVMVLDDAVAPLSLSADELGLSRNYVVEATGLQDGRAGPFRFAGGLRAETPLAPAQLSARRQEGGIVFRWIRRGRIDADRWEAADIPLDEEAERYRLDILASDGRVLRTRTVTAPASLYTPAEEIADFGSAQTRIRIRVTQLGRRVPVGISSTASLQP